MVLDHVTGRADPVVIAAPSAKADVLGHGDLHVVDEVGVPYRFVQLVGEPQRQDVLDGFLAEVVVDAKHRLLGEHAVDHSVELFGALQVVAERFLDDHPTPAAVLGTCQPRLLQLLAHHLEGLRRNRQVERVIAVGAALGVKLLQRLGQPLECLLVVECAPYEPNALGQPVPDLLAVGCARVRPDRVADELAEILVGPVPSGKADQGEVRR